MTEIGFTKKSRGLFTIQSGEHACGIVGFPGGMRSGVYEVAPTLGVSFIEVERIVNECDSRVGKPKLVWSISSPIGYQMPQDTFFTWSFDGGDETDSTFAHMFRTIDVYGKKFIVERSTLKTGLDYMLHGRTVLEHVQYSIPATMYLLGQIESALDIFKVKKSNSRERHGPPLWSIWHSQTS